MERMKNMATRVWSGICRVVCNRVFAAVLMCAVTLSMVMGVSSHTRVYTVNEGDSSRVVVTLSDTPYSIGTAMLFMLRRKKKKHTQLNFLFCETAIKEIS